MKIQVELICRGTALVLECDYISLEPRPLLEEGERKPGIHNMLICLYLFTVDSIIFCFQEV